MTSPHGWPGGDQGYSTNQMPLAIRRMVQEANENPAEFDVREELDAEPDLPVLTPEEQAEARDDPTGMHGLM